MKRRRWFGVLTALALAGACACAAQAEETRPQPKTEFTQAELLADYDRLWDDLYENYPFFTVLAQRGIDVEGLRLENRALLEDRVTDLAGFASLLRDTFYRMGNLAHLGLVEPDRYAFYRSTLLPSLPQGVHDGRLACVYDPQAQASYALLGAGDDVPRLFKPTPEVEMRYFAEADAAYFRFKSFDRPTYERDRDVVAEYLRTLGDVAHIIFDITGNPGGFAVCWQDNIVSPFGGMCESYTFLKRSPVNERFFFDDPRQDIRPISALPPEAERPDFVHDLGFTHFVRAQIQLPNGAFSGRRIDSQARRWVLTDQGTFSAADGLAAFCRRSGWATLVGRTTSGDGAVSLSSLGVAMIRLPNTGLLVMFSTSTAANADGTMNAAVGTAPDIASERGESPLDTCLRVIATERRRLKRLSGGE